MANKATKTKEYLIHVPMRVEGILYLKGATTKLCDAAAKYPLLNGHITDISPETKQTSAKTKKGAKSD